MNALSRPLGTQSGQHIHMAAIWAPTQDITGIDVIFTERERLVWLWPKRGNPQKVNPQKETQKLTLTSC